MSWTITLVIKTGPDTETWVKDWHITYNLGKMIRLYPPMSKDGMKTIDSMTTTDAAELISGLRHALETERQRYEALNPSNGWGNYDGLLKWAHEFIEACHDNPYCTVNVW
jgi:hypothetical protein